MVVEVLDKQALQEVVARLWNSHNVDWSYSPQGYYWWLERCQYLESLLEGDLPRSNVRSNTWQLDIVADLSRAFFWNATPQGFDYWSEFSDVVSNYSSQVETTPERSGSSVTLNTEYGVW